MIPGHSAKPDYRLPRYAKVGPHIGSACQGDSFTHVAPRLSSRKRCEHHARRRLLYIFQIAEFGMPPPT